VTDIVWFLLLDGIPGDSADAHHSAEIELDTLNWGASVDRPASTGAGSGTGRPRVHALHASARLGRSSPLLFLSTVREQHLRTAKVTGVLPGEHPRTYVELVLSDAVITAWSVSAEPGEVRDSLSLEFGTVSYTVRPQRPDGTPDEPVVAEWDLDAHRW